MKVDISEGVIRLEVQDLLEYLSSEERSGLAESLAIMDDVFDAVCDRLIDGFTDGGNWVSPDRLATKWRTKLAQGNGPIASRLVGDLLEKVKNTKASERRTSAWAWAMWHAWPEGHYRARPESPSFESTPRPSDTEVAEIADRIVGDE